MSQNGEVWLSRQVHALKIGGSNPPSAIFLGFILFFHIVSFIGRDINVLTIIAQWRSLAIAHDLGSWDRRFKSYLCNQRAVLVVSSFFNKDFFIVNT